LPATSTWTSPPQAKAAVMVFKVAGLMLCVVVFSDDETHDGVLIGFK
jgi:hypothetical protein